MISDTALPSSSDKLRALNTPEGVDLHIEIASYGARIGAAFIDCLCIFLIWLGMTLLGISVVSHRWNDIYNSVVVIIWLLITFVLANFWFILFEMSARGATPGKRLLGLRVIARDGGALTAGSIVARNLVRYIEQVLPVVMLMNLNAAGLSLLGWLWPLFFLIFPLLNKDRMRLGDVVAGTWVIHNTRMKMKADLTADTAYQQADFQFTPEQLNVYGAYEIQALEGVLREKNSKALSTIADVVRNKIGWPYGDDDRAFLEAYYIAVRAKLERNMLFGKKRRDKFDEG